MPDTPDSTPPISLKESFVGWQGQEHRLEFGVLGNDLQVRLLRNDALDSPVQWHKIGRIIDRDRLNDGLMRDVVSAVPTNDATSSFVVAAALDNSIVVPYFALDFANADAPVIAPLGSCKVEHDCSSGGMSGINRVQLLRNHDKLVAAFEWVSSLGQSQYCLSLSSLLPDPSGQCISATDDHQVIAGAHWDSLVSERAQPFYPIMVQDASSDQDVGIIAFMLRDIVCKENSVADTSVCVLLSKLNPSEPLIRDFTSTMPATGALIPLPISKDEVVQAIDLRSYASGDMQLSVQTDQALYSGRGGFAEETRITLTRSTPASIATQSSPSISVTSPTASSHSSTIKTTPRGSTRPAPSASIATQSSPSISVTSPTASSHSSTIKTTSRRSTRPVTISNSSTPTASSPTVATHTYIPTTSGNNNSTSPALSGSSAAIVAFPIIGAILLLVLVVCTIYACYRRNQNTRNSSGLVDRENVEMYENDNLSIPRASSDRSIEVSCDIDTHRESSLRDRISRTFTSFVSRFTGRPWNTERVPETLHGLPTGLDGDFEELSSSTYTVVNRAYDPRSADASRDLSEASAVRAHRPGLLQNTATTL